MHSSPSPSGDRLRLAVAIGEELAFLPPLLLLSEVAEVLRVSASSVERLLRRGAFEGGVVRFGGSTRVRRSRLVRFLAESTASPGAGSGGGASSGPGAGASSLRATLARIEQERGLRR